MLVKPSRWLAVLACGFAVSAYAVPNYQFTDLGEGVAFAINNHGQVAGIISIPSPDPSLPFALHAALFSKGTVTDLGTLGGNASANSYPTSINDAGHVVGWSYLPDSEVDQRGHVYGFASFIYKNGQMSALSSDNSNRAFAINNRGQMAVTYGELDGYTDSDFRTSYIQTQNKRVQINKLGGPTGVNALNDQGQATGDLRPVNAGPYAPQHAYLYSQGVTTDLGTLGGDDSIGTGINNLAQVTGYADLAPDSNGIHGTHAFLYDQGHMSDLGTLGGLSSHGLGINDRGEVVGFSEVNRNSGSTEAFLYSNGKMVSLQQLMAPVIGPEWSLNEAGGINERGDITGWGMFNGEAHAFVLTAVPEPETIALALAGLVCVGLCLRGAQARDKGPANVRASSANAMA